MAPKKRTTNKKKNNPKAAKLEAFLKDFDDEVQVIVEHLKEKTNKLLKDADNLYKVALIKLPKAMREMNWLDMCGTEKPKSPVVDEKKDAEEAGKVESTLAEDHAKSTKKAIKALSRVNCSEDEENHPPKSTARKVGRAKKAPPASQKKKPSINKRHSAIKKSSKKTLYTPARSFLETSLLGPTPLVTPRFDSRLPKTPAVRNPRHREKVYSISVNGSPIAGTSEDIVINVPLGNGESIQLLASEMDSVDLSQLDEGAIRSIRTLQNRLTALCGSSC